MQYSLGQAGTQTFEFIPFLVVLLWRSAKNDVILLQRPSFRGQDTFLKRSWFLVSLTHGVIIFAVARGLSLLVFPVSLDCGIVCFVSKWALSNGTAWGISHQELLHSDRLIPYFSHLCWAHDLDLVCADLEIVSLVLIAPCLLRLLMSFRAFDLFPVSHYCHRQKQLDILLKDIARRVVLHLYSQTLQWTFRRFSNIRLFQNWLLAEKGHQLDLCFTIRSFGQYFVSLAFSKIGSLDFSIFIDPGIVPVNICRVDFLKASFIYVWNWTKLGCM